MTFANLAQDVGGWSGPVLALIALIGLGGTVATLRQDRNDTKRARTLDYLRRLYGLEFAQLHMQVLTYLDSGDPSVFLGPHEAAPGPTSRPETEADADLAYDSLDLEQQANVFLVLNFYEELSGSYRARLLDEEIAERMLLPAILEAWSYAEWFVKVARRRTKKNHEGSCLTRDAAPRAAEEVLIEWQRLAKEIQAGSPRRYSGRRWLEDPRWLKRGLLIPLGAAIALVVLVTAASAADGPHDISSTFLYSSAAICLLAAAIGIALLLVDPQHRRAALATAALAWTLTVSLTATLDLNFSLAPPGHEGKQGIHGPPGKAGPEGKPGRDGTVGPEGPPGPRGEQGLRGHRGPTGHRGHEGPPGPRGPRGYPGTSEP